MLPSQLSKSKPLVESDTDLEPNSYSLQKFKLYETGAKFYLIGRDESRTRWRVLMIDRSEPAELNIYEDPAVYSSQTCNDLLNRLSEGNHATGGLKFVTKAYGIVGFVKFMEPYYMILVTRRKLIGKVCGHAIYGIEESQLLTVPHSSVQTDVAWSKDEYRYKKLFSSIDLSKDFFYSYTYRIMWSLQKNACLGDLEKMPYDDMFVWNTFLTHGIRQQLKSLHWTVALVHGFFKQVHLSTCGNLNFMVTLIARQSSHFAGTRYLKRGVNDKGRVANDVETEQIVCAEPWEEFGQISSVVQHRGSIPLFWSQETSILRPKPDIILHRYDPTYEATRLHFQNLSVRYGNPTIVLNLIKTVEKKPRETILCHEFANAVAYLNHALPKANHLKFIHCDFHMFSKRNSESILEQLGSIVTDALDLVGFYYSGTSPTHTNDEGLGNSSKDQENGQVKSDECRPHEGQGKRRRFQSGILRSNCIDCLDRTNVAQYAFGLAAFNRQLQALGLYGPQVDLGIHIVAKLTAVYESMGDALAIQYGGSAAHNTVLSDRQGRWRTTTQLRKLFRSIKRHYNNVYMDGEKQDGINIFLGHFRPEKTKLALWQLSSDHHLQLRRTGCDPLHDNKLSFKKSCLAGNLLGQNKVRTPFSPTVSKEERNFVKLTFLKNTAQRNDLTRCFTINELELKGTMINGYLEENIDAKDNKGNSFTVFKKLLHMSARRQNTGDCIDCECISSSGSSYEDATQERHSVLAANINSLSGSGFLLSAIDKVEIYQQNHYFQDAPVISLHTNVDKRAVHANISCAKSVLDDLCVPLARKTAWQVEDTESTRAGETLIEGFSRDFVNWIYSDQALCH